MNKKLILSLILFLGILAIIPLAQAGNGMIGVISNNIFNATNTEINSATSSLSVNVTGNCSHYSVNITMGGTVVVNTQAIDNATTTPFTTSTLTENANYTTNATFWNVTCDADSVSANITANSVFQINGRPTIDSVSADLEEISKGKTITWTVPWTDVNSSNANNDTVSAYFCKTNAFAAGACTGGEWSNSTPGTDGKSTVPYKVSDADSAGTNNFFVFLRDDNSYDIALPTSGSFIVAGGGSAGSGSGTSFTTVPISPTPSAAVPSAELTIGERIGAFFQGISDFFSNLWLRMTT